jgi:hypothetical protein
MTNDRESGTAPEGSQTHPLPEAALPELPVVAWIVRQSKDGKRRLSMGEACTNPEYVKMHSREWLFEPLTLEAAATQALLTANERIAELERENRVLQVKTTNSLANNLCPDHRDKQAFKPCLACTIESLEARAAALEAERDALKQDAAVLAALARSSQRMDENIAKLRSGDMSDLDPDLLEEARITLAALSAASPNQDSGHQAGRATPGVHSDGEASS